MLSISCSLLPTRLYLVTFTIVLPLICFLLPLNQSIYYQLFRKLNVLLKPDAMSHMDSELLTELFTKNTERLNAADKFLELQQSLVAKNGSTQPVKYWVKSYIGVSSALAQQMPLWLERSNSNGAVTVSIVIISAGRDSVVSNGQQFAPRYLTQNVARFISLISNIEHSDRVSYHLSVCSVGERITAEERSVGRVVPIIRDPQLDVGHTFGPFHDRLAWRYEKEKRDYTYCLRQAAHGVQFVLIVEDDALPMNDCLSVIARLVTSHRTGRPDSHTAGQRFYVKLYHPVHLQGYISLEIDRLPELVATAVVLGSCLYLVVSWFSGMRRSDGNSTLKHIPWIQCCIYCGLIALCVGRVHMNSWRRLFTPYAHYLVSDQFCCTQAVLYTRQTALDLAVYLDNTSCNETYHKDDALWKFQASRYLIQPNLFQHVGVWSSVRRGFVDPHTLS